MSLYSLSELCGCRANAVAEFSEVAKLQSLPFLRALILTGTLCVSDETLPCSPPPSDFMPLTNVLWSVI